ncbi:MAG: DNA repair protein RecN [Acidobacteria bacterium]|nr:DNA repair protein RecN [Acidobacteriota bacterium]
MLVELLVENYAVIERLRVRFRAGFHVLSGETGSGKSIVVGALGLLLGGRASAEMVRTGAERARVAGIFELPDTPAVRAQLESAGLALEEGELLIEREILSNGKSRAFAASRPVTVTVLKDLAAILGEIHGQHDQQRLFDMSGQLDMLDEFARAEPLLDETGRLFADWNSVTGELEQLDRTEQERLRLADLWSYQVREIEAVAPKPGEDESLEQEKRRLQNVTRLEQNASGAFEALYDSPASALSQMRQARKRIEDLSRIDASLEPLMESLRGAEAQTEDVSYSLRDYLGKLEADPARLDQVESRLAAVEKLKRKYGATIPAILTFYDTIRRQLDSAENAESLRVELKTKADQAAASFREAAARLSHLRQEAARKLEKKVESELASLAMERTRFRIVFSDAGWSAGGVDAIEFLISPNLGEEPRPLDRVASGGELSRVALALKTCLIGTSKPARGVPRTLVFDEVDAGIGGRVAETVGRRLRQISASNQVLCVTHLAQIAGFADHHYSVEKRESKGRTAAAIEELAGEARTREIGRMLSGDHLTPEAIRHAEQLLKLGAAG